MPGPVGLKGILTVYRAIDVADKLGVEFALIHHKPHRLSCNDAADCAEIIVGDVRNKAWSHPYTILPSSLSTMLFQSRS